MPISADDYEKLGAFYLGREYDLQSKSFEDDLLLYDSKDLVTHGVVLGMTGSGKTGLCLSLLEEAAIDRIPSIVIDPKGDIANLLLSFPDLAGSDFRPWINEEDATKKGVTPDEFADGQADLWKKGLGQWGQSGERIGKLKETVDMAVYTPGSNAGVPVSILSSLKAPPFEVLDDAEIFAERIESSVSSILSLLGIDADPIQDPEHILLSNIFSHCWTAEQDLSLELLIGYIQTPPFEKIGVLGLEMFYPEKKRFELAMKMNNLLASPGFSIWLQGAPLDIQRMLYTPEGKPRVSIFSIAHLGDSERMFFVSLLLNEMLGWMRAQSGTTSLRAMLYMDEIYGYLPPTANPPSKKPLLTMLKQARAFGLGVLLATQNPVDLDYKALSNMGTWFLGRLQTERDKMRVLDGLEGAAASQGGEFDRGKMEETLAGLGSRVFLMNNVHEDAPVIFHVRWAMSYLRGPLSRRQIKKLMDPRRDELLGLPSGDAAEPEEKAEEVKETKVEPQPTNPREAVQEQSDSPAKAGENEFGSPNPPELPEGVVSLFSPVIRSEAEGTRVYCPAFIQSAEVSFSDDKRGVDTTVVCTQAFRINAETGEIAADQPISVIPKGVRPLKVFVQKWEPGAAFAQMPNGLTKSTTYKRAASKLKDHLYKSERIRLWTSPSTDLYSKVGESEGDFRVRLEFRMREERDRQIAALRERYGKRFSDLETDRRKAQQYLAEQSAQASSAAMDTASRIGTSILGALFGRKFGRRRSSGTSEALKQRSEAKRAQARLDKVHAEMAAMEREVEGKIQEIKNCLNAATERLDEEIIKPYKKNIQVTVTGILWLPHVGLAGKPLVEAWR